MEDRSRRGEEGGGGEVRVRKYRAYKLYQSPNYDRGNPTYVGLLLVFTFIFLFGSLASSGTSSPHRLAKLSSV